MLPPRHADIVILLFRQDLGRELTQPGNGGYGADAGRAGRPAVVIADLTGTDLRGYGRGFRVLSGDIRPE